MNEISSFALPAKTIAQAFHHVMGETNVEPKLLALLLPLYTYANQSGWPKHEPLALAMLDEVPWEWPWFDSCFAEFEKDNAWPYMWNQGEKTMAHMQRYSATRQLRKLRVFILAHTLSRVATNIRSFTKNRPYWEKHGWRLAGSLNCPVEDGVAKDFEASINLDDWRTWPPFFPGDRTSIMGLGPAIPKTRKSC